MWPTEDTLYLLVLGLLPVAYVLYRVLISGPQALASLGAAFVLATWWAYQLTPWLSFGSGPWQGLMLVPSEIDNGILFSSLAMIAFLVGYRMALGRKWGVLERRQALAHYRWASALVAKPWPLVALAALNGLLFLLLLSDWTQLWEFEESRAAWFDVGSISRSADFNATVAITWTLSSAAVTVMAAVYVFGSERVSPGRWLIGIACLLVACSLYFFQFSRAAGLPFVIFGIIGIALYGRKSAVVAGIFILIGLWFSITGMMMRGSYNLGVGSFLKAVINLGSWPAAEMDAVQESGALIINSMDPWTLKSNSRAYAVGIDADLVLDFLWNLHPLPSFILPVESIGPSLTELMNVVGIVDLTTPALAEIYYVFGHFGVLFILFLGVVLAVFERRARRSLNALNAVCMLFCFLGIIIGLHGSVRAMTRPVVYAALLVIAYNLLTIKRKVDDR